MNDWSHLQQQLIALRDSHGRKLVPALAQYLNVSYQCAFNFVRSDRLGKGEPSYSKGKAIERFVSCCQRGKMP